MLMIHFHPVADFGLPHPTQPIALSDRLPTVPRIGDTIRLPDGRAVTVQKVMWPLPFGEVVKVYVG